MVSHVVRYRIGGLQKRLNHNSPGKIFYSKYFEDIKKYKKERCFIRDITINIIDKSLKYRRIQNNKFLKAHL